MREIGWGGGGGVVVKSTGSRSRFPPTICPPPKRDGKWENLDYFAKLGIIENWIIVQCKSRDLIGLAAMVYEPLYHCRRNGDH